MPKLTTGYANRFAVVLAAVLPICGIIIVHLELSNDSVMHDSHA